MHSFLSGFVFPGVSKSQQPKRSKKKKKENIISCVGVAVKLYSKNKLYVDDERM